MKELENCVREGKETQGFVLDHTIRNTHTHTNVQSRFLTTPAHLDVPVHHSTAVCMNQRLHELPHVQFHIFKANIGHQRLRGWGAGQALVLHQDHINMEYDCVYMHRQSTRVHTHKSLKHTHLKARDGDGLKHQVDRTSGI